MPIPPGAILVLLGMWTLGGSVAGENAAERPQVSGTLINQSPRPLDSWRCVEPLLCATVAGSVYGLLAGAVAVVTVWLAQVTSESVGLVATVQRVPLMGLLIGAVLGAVEGVGKIAELLGPGIFWEVVEGAMKGATTGARVAGVGGVTIGGAMCAVAVVPVRNMVRGGDLRVAPLATVSAAMGAARVALSLAPEAVAMGTFMGAVLGSARDLIVLKTLGTVFVGGYFGVKGQKIICEDWATEVWGVAALPGWLVGAGGAVFLITLLGSPLGIFPMLVSVIVGIAMAFLVWRVGELLCQSVAKVLEELFGAISTSAHYGPAHT
ncbi:uncharacterized protein LOC108926670 [Scleropages formosus]|uniref:uncharacterized protein LOC108926670 n=1 Tax=Scleropages formosus TaxID=113540 RepID=UPI000878BD27|nr:uncharacterized protein LOC108926670 [Scleropages formosus]